MSISSHIFPDQWKLANVIPLYKKKDPNHIENYRPVSLLSNIGKVLERVIFNRLYSHCKENNLLTWHNSGFKKCDSTINQLTYIVHELHQCLDNNEDACMVFLDASKAFDRIWPMGLIHKLRKFGVDGDILAWLVSYLENREIQVTLEGSTSLKRQLTAGVPQGSILAPLLFLIYTDDIINNLQCNPFLYADDTALMLPIDRINPDYSLDMINRDLKRLSTWAEQWFMSYNPSKTVYMIISNKKDKLKYPSPTMNNVPLTEVNQHKHLGLILTSNLSWGNHIDHAINKTNKVIGKMWQLNKHIPRISLENIYLTFARPILEFGSTIYDNCSANLSKRLEQTQRKAALACTRAYAHTSHERLLAELGWEKLALRRSCQKLTMFHKILNSETPPYLRRLVPTPTNRGPRLRNRNEIPIIKTRLVSFEKSYIPSTTKSWNSLDETIRQQQSVSSFKAAVRALLFKNRRLSLYSTGYGNGQINHARMRMGLSGLNEHRHRYNFIENGLCDYCTNQIEDTNHYLLQCPRFNTPRQSLLHDLSLVPNLDITTLNVNILLHGSDNNNVDNRELFSVVQKFIARTQRFM